MAADLSEPCSLDIESDTADQLQVKSKSDARYIKTGPQLNIGTRKQLRRFLQAILPEFLRVVNPRESGMLDVLMAADLLTDTDHESMSGKDVNCRKDQARKLLLLLNKMSVANFMNQVAPELLRQFSHIVPDEFILKEGEQIPADIDEHEECLRHDIVSRVREETLADMLYHHGCLSFEDYEDVVSGNYDKDIVWPKLLDSFSGHPDDVTAQLLSGLRELLEKYSLLVPGDLSKLLSRGLPCTCGKEPASLPVGSPMPIRKVCSWMKKSPFVMDPERSSGTSYIPNSQYTSCRSQTSNKDSHYTSCRSQTSNKDSNALSPKSGGVASPDAVVDSPNNAGGMLAASATSFRSLLFDNVGYIFVVLGVVGAALSLACLFLVNYGDPKPNPYQKLIEELNERFQLINRNMQLFDSKFQSIGRVLTEMDEMFMAIRHVFEALRQLRF